jgi:hypothetical protein
MAERDASALENGDFTAAHRIVRKVVGMSKKVKQPRPMWRTAGNDGQATETYQDERLAFRAHFGRQVQAEEVTFAGLVRRERETAENKSWRIQGETPGDMLRAIPAKSELELTMARSSVHKAIGEDRLPDELIRGCCKEVAALLHPVFTKAAVSLRPPLQWRGGQIV